MTERLGVPGKCRTCAHPERGRIELLLAGGASQSAVAKKFGLSQDTVNRHWTRGHVSDERKAALVLGPVQAEALAAKIAEESESVIDHHRTVRAGLYTMFSAALDAGDRQTGALVAGRLTEVNNSIAKITGELAQSPLIQRNTLNVAIGTPEVQGFLTDLARLLLPWPDARRTVADWLKERTTNARAALAPSQAPALEHQA